MVRYFTLCFLLLFGLYGHSQLSDFNLTVTVTDETCFGNGGLAFSVSGTEPGATIMYEVYKLPNTTTPIVTSAGNPVTGLSSGTYNIIAIQSLGGDIGTQQQEVVIANLTNPLSYVVQSHMLCPNQGVITVNILSGNAAGYEIVSGPNNFSASLQTSNIFTGLEPGMYLVGVHDAGPCGDFLTQHHQVFFEPQTLIEFIDRNLSTEFISCDEITVLAQHRISVDENAFPLTITFTTNPPDGSDPIIQTQIVTESDSEFVTQLIFEQSIPYYDEVYFYSIEIINVCGDTYTYTDSVTFTMEITASYDMSSCYGIFITVSNFFESYTIEFDTYPVGFDPELFNTNYPGPFTESVVSYGVDPTGEFLAGNYQVTLTDSCGRIKIETFTIAFPEDDPYYDFIITPPIVPDCECLGELIIMHTYGLETVLITDAPDDFITFLANQNLSLPYDISAYIAEAPSDYFLQFSVYGCGEYTIEVTDICGREFELIQELEAWNADIGFLLEQAPGCDGFGSVAITPNKLEGKIEAAYILDAPDEFYELFDLTPGEVHDVSEYIFYSDGGLSGFIGFWFITMKGLPQGDYEFDIQVFCDVIPFYFSVETYQQQTEIELEEMCSMFNLFFEHEANSRPFWSPDEKYWLERFNSTIGTWESLPNPDPAGNPSYTEYWIYPEQMNYNIPYQGNFRIMKEYRIWNNGNVIPSEDALAYCVESIYEFDFLGIPKINDVLYFPCPDGGNELFVNATGVAPLVYEITEKEGQPFYINNGQSNVFTNLESGVYNFRVTDDCDNIVNGVYEVGQSFDFNISATPLCNNEVGSLYVTNFSFLQYEWWEENNPDEILSTSYQLVFDPFNTENHLGTYHLSISYPGNPNSCVNQVLEYQINTNPPNAGQDATVVYCSLAGELLDLFSLLGSEFDDFGLWEDVSHTGELQNHILAIGNLLPGSYEFIYNIDTCEGTDQSLITIILLAEPEAPVVLGEVNICEGSDIELMIENPSEYYTYTWASPSGAVYTGETFFISEINTTQSGIYTITATVGSCSVVASVEIVINSLPDFYIFGDTMICTSQSTFLSVMSNNFNNSEANFNWYFNNVLLEEVDTSTIEAFRVGDYKVEVVLDECKSSEVITVMANDDMPAIVLKGVCVGADFIVSVINTEDFPNAIYSWTGPDNFLSFDTFVNASEQPLGEYTVEIINQDGCVVSASIDVKSIYCQIPKGISPNGDTLNDNFDLSNFEVERLKIFNRYGRMVYESGSGYTNQWYGQSTVNDKLLPAATYYYVVTFKGGEIKTGWVYLTRQE